MGVRCHVYTIRIFYTNANNAPPWDMNPSVSGPPMRHVAYLFVMRHVAKCAMNENLIGHNVTKWNEEFQSAGKRKNFLQLLEE